MEVEKLAAVIEPIKVLEIRKGDVFVLNVNQQHLSFEQVDTIKKQWDRVFPGFLLFVLESGTRLEIIRQVEVEGRG